MKIEELGNKVKKTTVAVAGKAGEVAKDLGKRAGNIIEENKLQAEVKERKRVINENFSKLGHILYDCGGKIDSNDYVMSIINQIDSEFAGIVEINSAIADMKGQNYCVVCGKTSKSDKRYCPNCGTAFEGKTTEE